MKQDEQDRQIQPIPPEANAGVPDSTIKANGQTRGPEAAVKNPLEEGRAFMFCTACGTKNGADANFCKQCGRKLDRSGPLKISEEAFAEAGSKDERVRAYLVSAYNQYETGDIISAIVSCNKAIEAQPDSTDAHSLLSTLYEKQGDREKAIAARERVLLLNPGSIADREKLDQLRDGTLKITKLKINSARPLPSTSIIDSRAGAALLAVTVTLFVLASGLAAVNYGRTHANAGQIQGGDSQSTRAAAANNPLPANGILNNSGGDSGGRMPAQSQPVFNPGNPQFPVQQRGAAIQPNQARQRQLDEDQTPVRQIQPITVPNPSSNSFADRENRTTASNNAGQANSGTVHLPDNGLSPSELGPAPGPQQPAAQAPRTDHGKIEIIVSSNPTSDRASSTGSGSGQANVNSRGDSTQSSMDSRGLRRIAQDYQLKGQYKLAISNYIKALDGAGDEAASIHYQIGLSYQRLDERENAIAQYNAAIAAYREQISGGHNADSANRGIKASEAGIRACQ